MSTPIRLPLSPRQATVLARWIRGFAAQPSAEGLARAMHRLEFPDHPDCKPDSVELRHAEHALYALGTPTFDEVAALREVAGKLDTLREK